MHFSSSISLAIFMAFFGPFLFLFLATAKEEEMDIWAIWSKQSCMELESPPPKGPPRSWEVRINYCGLALGWLIASCKTNNNNTITRSNNTTQFIRVMLQLQGRGQAGTQSSEVVWSCNFNVRLCTRLISNWRESDWQSSRFQTTSNRFHNI